MSGDTQDHAVTEQLVSALAPVPSLRARRDALRGKPDAGSLADVEAGSAVCQIAWVQASTAVAVGIDNLIAWNALLLDAKTQPFVAHYSLLRASLESSVTARWILMPTVSSVERAARGIAVQRESFDERRKFEEAALRQPPQRSGKARSGAFRAEILDRAVRRWGIPRRRLNLIDLHREFAQPHGAQLRGDLLYRLLSGFAHGRDWAQLVMSGVVENRPPAGGRPGTTKLTAGPAMTVYATRVALTVAGEALADLERYGRP